MKITSNKIVWIISAICCLGLFYPKQITLTPEIELTVYFDNENFAKNVEVKRSWNSYAGDGWKVKHLITDNNGKVKFERVQKRMPIIWERLSYYLPIFSMHENNLNVGSITARDPQNHFVYGRVDYQDETCCPAKIVMTKQNFELTDSLFGFGELESK